MIFIIYKNTLKIEIGTTLGKKNLIEFSYSFRIFSILLIINLLACFCLAQPSQPNSADDSLSTPYNSHTEIINGDTSLIKSTDSLHIDSNGTVKISPNAIREQVKYRAIDSIRFDILKRKAYLFKDAVVEYEDIELKADYIEIDFSNNELYASGIADANGNIIGNPVFKQGEYVFQTHEIKYNFKTKKGKIWEVITSEGEGYIYGEQIKKLDDNSSFIKKGKYTTCELEHPHFEIAFTKAKVIPNDKIVTGPAYLSFGGVPTIIAIPFGYFPIQKGRQSGVIMPTFGESANRGFYFENFGYYFGISDNFDLLLAGDVYTRGSWAAKVRSNYVFRYKCRGNVNLSFAQNLFGEKLTSSFYKTNDFKLYWAHQQDPKSNPTTRFSAHIDIVSRTFNTYNPSSVRDYLSNQYTSKLNFSTNARDIFYFDATASYSQNTLTGVVDIALPDISMSVNQFYPFRKRNKTGPLKWYDNISLKWTSQFANKVQTYDSLLLKPETWENMHLGMKHLIPLTIPIKIGKNINWNSSFNFTERWYLQSMHQIFMIDTTNGENNPYILYHLKRDFHALHDIDLSTSLTTKIYVMYKMKKGWLRAVRHVITPNLSFTYTPNLSKLSRGTYFNTISGQEVSYSYFENSIFGDASSYSSAIARLSISNNLEMKVRSRKDTITGEKKVVLIENLTLSTYYNFLADSLNWAPLSISGRTTLFKHLYITFNMQFDPYSFNEMGRRVNVTEWKKNKRLYRFSSTDVSVGLNFTLNQDLFKGKSKPEEIVSEIPKEEGTVFTENSLGMPTRRPDFKNPWSITINYTFAYTTRDNPYFYIATTQPLYDPSLGKKKYNQEIIQTLNVSGDINVTKKWKVGFTTGYDFIQKDLSYTSLDIYRDLHCWEMRFNWIPFGMRKGWSFTINVKASVLQDLKYNMKRDFRENFKP